MRDDPNNNTAKCLDCNYRWTAFGPTCPACGSTNTAINPKTGNYKCYSCGVEDSDPEEIKCANCGSTNVFEGETDNSYYISCHNCGHIMKVKK